MSRTLYLIAYDISHPKRLNRVRHFLKNYSTGGQKSVYECFLTDWPSSTLATLDRHAVHSCNPRKYGSQVSAQP